MQKWDQCRGRAYLTDQAPTPVAMGLSVNHIYVCVGHTMKHLWSPTPCCTLCCNSVTLSHRNNAATQFRQVCMHLPRPLSSAAASPGANSESLLPFFPHHCVGSAPWTFYFSERTKGHQRQQQVMYLRQATATRGGYCLALEGSLVESLLPLYLKGKIESVGKNAHASCMTEYSTTGPSHIGLVG